MISKTSRVFHMLLPSMYSRAGKSRFLGFSFLKTLKSGKDQNVDFRVFIFSHSFFQKTTFFQVSLTKSAILSRQAMCS